MGYSYHEIIIIVSGKQENRHRTVISFSMGTFSSKASWAFLWKQNNIINKSMGLDITHLLIITIINMQCIYNHFWIISTIQIMWWILFALWLVIAHDLMIYLSEYRQMDDVTGSCFSLFRSTWCAVLKCLQDYFSVSLQKRFAGASYKEEQWRNQDKQSSSWLENA